MKGHVHIYLGFEAMEAEGESLYGKNPYYWKYQCPSCGGVYRHQDLEKFEDECSPMSLADLAGFFCPLCRFEINELDYSKPHTRRLLIDTEDGTNADLAGIDFYRGGGEPRIRLKIYHGLLSYIDESRRLFGENGLDIKIQCPKCFSIYRLGDQEDFPELCFEGLVDELWTAARLCPYCDHDLETSDSLKDCSALVPRNAPEFPGEYVRVFDFYRGDDPEWEGTDEEA